MHRLGMRHRMLCSQGRNGKNDRQKTCSDEPLHGKNVARVDKFRTNSFILYRKTVTGAAAFCGESG